MPHQEVARKTTAQQPWNSPTLKNFPLIARAYKSYSAERHSCAALSHETRVDTEPGPVSVTPLFVRSVPRDPAALRGALATAGAPYHAPRRRAAQLPALGRHITTPLRHVSDP